MPPPSSPLVSIGMALLAVLVAIGLVAAIALARRPGESRGATARRGALAAVALSAWLAATFTIAETGRLTEFVARPPPLMLLMLGTLVGTIALALSPLGRRLAHALPLAALVGLHSFRVPLELVMHGAARAGVMPAQMTFTGLNFDVVTGVLALGLAPLVARGRAPRWLLVGFQVVGSLLLAGIGMIAIASTPLFHAFGEAPERLNTWVAHPPYVWLPTLLFPSALLGHLLLARRLAAR